MSVRILIGDARERLRALPDASVHCVVTSPPYFGLRDYGVEGQIGLEASPEDYVAVMVEVFREVRRVLRDDGTLWLNIGDSYAGYWGDKYADKPFGKDRTADCTTPPNKKSPDFRTAGFKPKDLLGVPWHLAFALRADGWYLRSEIIWAKPNPMPESVTDRPTSAHEKVFLLSKRARYFYDAEAVREPFCDDRMGNPGNYTANYSINSGRNDAGCKNKEWLKGKENGGRNLRNVWTITPSPFPGAHFATFPPALVEPCIKAGTSEKGVCQDCGAPWRRQLKRIKHLTRNMEEQRRLAAERTGRTDGAVPGPSGMVDATETVGWSPSCACDAGKPVPATVLDPFGGSGTLGLVADRLGRDAILIELNPEYAEMAKRRLANDAGMFSAIETDDPTVAA